MKQNEDNSKWLDEIRDKMTDFEAELPVDGWDKVSSAISENQSPAPRMGVRESGKGIRTIWSKVAAAVVFLLLTGAGIYTLNKAHDEVVEPSLAAGVSMPEVEEATATLAEQTLEIEETATASAAKTQNLRPAEFDNYATRRSKPSGNIATESLQLAKAEADNHPSALTAAEAEVIGEGALQAQSEKTGRVAAEQVDAQETQPTLKSREEEAVLLAMETVPKNNSRKPWNFGVSGGGGYAAGSTGNSDYSMSDATIAPDSAHMQAKAPTRSAEAEDQVLEAYNHRSYSFGLSVSKDLSERLAIESGIVYTLLTSDLKMTSGKKTQRLHYLGIPLKLRVKLYGNSDWAFYTAAGGMAERAIYAVRGGEKFENNNWQWSANATVGAQYMLDKHIGLYLEPGVNYYFDDGSGVISQRTERPLSFNLQLGIRFSY